MDRSRRTDERAVRERVARERSIWRFRLGAACFLTLQTVIEPGDDATVSWLLVAGFVLSVVGTWRPLHRDADLRKVRRVGAASMAVDAVVVALLLANNLTDPAEPIYLVAILAQIEATVRWPRRGGLVAGVVAGVAAGVWTVSVHWRIDMEPELSFATMRAGTIIALGAFLWYIVRQLSQQHELLESVFDTSRDLIVVLDARGAVVSANAASIDVLGVHPGEMIGRDAREFVHPDDHADDPARSVLASVADEPVLIQRRFLRADGEVRWLELTIAAGFDELIHVSGRDVTERLEAERRTAASEQRFRSLFDHNSDAVYSFDLDGHLVEANPATEQLTGYAVDQLVDRGFLGLIVPEHRDRTLAHFERAVAGDPQNYETVVEAKDGRRIELDVTNTPIVVDGEVVGVFGVAKDVTDRRALERELGHQASHDSLTGLPNRFHLERVLTSSLSRTSNRARTLLFLDLDRFKVVNDSLGHRWGDVVLLEVVSRLRHHVRADDLLARWAGDEFCLLLGERTSAQTAVAIAERLLEAVAEPLDLEGRKVRLTASIGVARSDDVDDPERFVQIADLAMYEAKRAGRNQVAVYDAADERPGPSQLDLETELHDALESARLELHYQPIVELGTGRIVAVESLVRWPQDDGTMRLPGLFVPLAEETGMIRRLTRFVLAEACRCVTHWDREFGDRGVQMWVNISAADLQDVTFVDDVTGVLAETGVRADRLVLEVTESMLLRDLPRVDAVVEALRDAGVSFAIDDFGTGYSSMGQLHRLRVAACKIDRDFVAAAPRSERGAAVVRSMVELGEAFGFEVVGEGVETAEELEQITEAGCRFGQGRFLAPPAAAAELEVLLRNGALLPASAPGDAAASTPLRSGP